MASNERNIKFERASTQTYCPTPLTPEGFKWAVNNLQKDQLPGFLRSYIRDRIPFAFLHEPLLWEAIRDWLALKLGTYSGNIGLNGSAQIGFSAAPSKFGTTFSNQNSDLDFFVVDSVLFEKLKIEVRKFCFSPESLNSYQENVTVLSRTLERGFFDTNKIPSNHDKYPDIASINNIASIIVAKLLVENFNLKKSHIRIYSSWISYSKQMRINLENLKDKI